MRKHWFVASIILAAIGLTLAAVLYFTRKPADSASSSPGQPSEEPQARLAEGDQLNVQAITMQEEGKYSEALALNGKILANERAVLGDRHEDVVATLRRMAELHTAPGRLRECAKNSSGNARHPKQVARRETMADHRCSSHPESGRGAVQNGRSSTAKWRSRSD